MQSHRIGVELCISCCTEEVFFLTETLRHVETLHFCRVNIDIDVENLAGFPRKMIWWEFLIRTLVYGRVSLLWHLWICLSTLWYSTMESWEIPKLNGGFSVETSTGDREGILFCSLNLNFFRLRFYIWGFLKMAESPSQHGCFNTQTDEIWMIWG
jgi:hypothetical protein